MGGGAWTTDTYTARVAAKKAAGKSAFDYSDQMKATTPRAAWKVADALDPKSVNNNGPHTGKNIREAYDSDEHPDSLPIAVLFDVTGSMGRIPRVLQAKLPSLHGLLKRRGYVDDAQIMFGAIGDAYTDRLPLQVGQFESDNRMDEQLEQIVLEGGGGGQVHESYELGAYFVARHTALDCFEKRQKKGYLFLMGDEMPYEKVRAEQVERLIGDKLAEDIPTREIFRELEERFHVFFLFVAQGNYPEGRILPAWRKLLGERALVLEDAEAVCETIALTIAMLEGSMLIDEQLEELTDVAVDKQALAAAGRALAGVGAGGGA